MSRSELEPSRLRVRDMRNVIRRLFSNKPCLSPRWSTLRVVLYSVCFSCLHISCCKHIQAFRRVCRPCPYSAARLMLVYVVNVCVTPYRRTVPLSRSPYVVMLKDNIIISRQHRLLCGLLLLCAGLHHIRRRRNAHYPRRASIRRVKPCLSTVVRDLSEGEFRRVFRMQRSTFTSLLNVLLPESSA
jgi:hypothetical protein